MMLSGLWLVCASLDPRCGTLFKIMGPERPLSPSLLLPIRVFFEKSTGHGVR